jgi:hypothetical protein
MDKMQATRWTSFSTQMKKTLDRERYVLNMYNNMPDDMYYEISSFLGTSFKDILQNVNQLFKKHPYYKSPFPKRNEPIECTDQLVLYKIDEINEDLSNVIWKAGDKKINISILDNFYILNIDNKELFEGLEKTFQKKHPTYFNYMKLLINEIEPTYWSKFSELDFILYHYRVYDYWHDCFSYGDDDFTIDDYYNAIGDGEW